MRTLTLTAPAKVNFRLDVLSRRPDGYHELRMLMQRVDLCDRLTITVGGPPGIHVSCDRADIPGGPENLAWRAADALLQLLADPPGVDIRIEKRIPAGGGLGGGSSDAATVLMGLNDLLGLGLGNEELQAIGLTLGADVPFFIFQRPALAEGIGERLTPLAGIPPAWLVLVHPGIPVATGWVYQNLQLTKLPPHSKIPSFFATLEELCAVLGNDLEPVACGHVPEIAAIKAQLTAAGALGVLMSGSGSTVFGVFADEPSARQAAATCGAGRDWFVAAVPTLP